MRSLAALVLLGAGVLASVVETDVAAQNPFVAVQVQSLPPLPEGCTLNDPELERERQRQVAAGERTEDGLVPLAEYRERPGERVDALRCGNAILMPPIEAAPDPMPPPPSSEDVYFDALNANIAACMKRDVYDPPVLCYTKLSPTRCEPSALAMMGGRTDDQRTWMLCVRWCATASWWSRTFGECAAP